MHNTMKPSRTSTRKPRKAPFKLKPQHLLLTVISLGVFPILLLELSYRERSKNHPSHPKDQKHHDQKQDQHHPVVLLDERISTKPNNIANLTSNSNTTRTTTPVRIRPNRSRLHKPLLKLSRHELHLEQLNSVDYYACCGLGHRFTKLTDAWYVSRKLNYALKTFWGYCNEHYEIFSSLFGEQPEEELGNVAADNQLVQIRNEVPTMVGLRRGNSTNKGESRLCPCIDEKIQLDLQFYKSLHQRFIQKERVHTFRTEHAFDHHTVIGIHVRAGNGETGDFVRKNRFIDDVDAWVLTVVRFMEPLLASVENPLIYLATDTPSMIDKFRSALAPVVVLDLPQDRAETGVFFGAQGDNMSTELFGSQCIEGWAQAVTDMMLLSSANIVIAARPSSFVQSMPLSLVFSRPGGKYCELPADASWFRCFDSFQEWCCGKSVSTADVMLGMQRDEYINMPKGPFNETQFKEKLQRGFRMRRTTELVLPKDKAMGRKEDLPYSWHKLVARFRDNTIDREVE